MPRSGYVPVKGSHRDPVPGARAIGPADPDEHIDVTVVLRPRGGANGAAFEGGARRRMSRAELAEARGADSQDLAAVERFAAEHGLQVLSSHAGRRRVVLSGSVADFEHAFDVGLARFEHAAGGNYRGRTGEVHVPRELAGAVVAVLGLDDRPQAHPNSIVLEELEDPDAGATLAPRAASHTYTPPQLADAYDFPDGDGSGQCIAIIELGGGFRRRDLSAYFRQIGTPVPPVVAVSVDHGRNRPSVPQSADGEVMLDIEAAGGVAPGARIAVYFAPNTDRGFVDAITAAVHDDQNEPSVISISWGAAESGWTQQAIAAMDDAFAEAAALGVTVYCAAGDDGSSDRVPDGKAHVDFPASSPHVVGCGGTHLEASGTSISKEVVWSTHGATGGGVSDVFPVPDWQRDAHVPPSKNPPGSHHGRGVPDVAGDADPATGYVVRVDGRTLVIGGTSAVAPLWAGLTARLNATLGAPIGFVNPLLYGIGSGPFHDITQGSNGAYSAGPGWDPCTGWGSPDGAKLLHALQAEQPADVREAATT